MPDGFVVDMPLARREITAINAGVRFLEDNRDRRTVFCLGCPPDKMVPTSIIPNNKSADMLFAIIDNHSVNTDNPLLCFSTFRYLFMSICDRAIHKGVSMTLVRDPDRNGFRVITVIMQRAPS